MDPQAGKTKCRLNTLLTPNPSCERQATEVAIAADVLNRMLDLGRPNYVRLA